MIKSNQGKEFIYIIVRTLPSDRKEREKKRFKTALSKGQVGDAQSPGFWT